MILQLPTLRHSNKSPHRGFTLVELLITISIVAIISAVGFTTFTQSQIRGRDAKRKQDLRSIAIALEIYYQRNGRYPQTPNNSWQYSTSASTPWISDTYTPAIPFNSSYISNLPVDPINSSAATSAYQYYSDTNTFGSCAVNQYYLLAAQLENTNDPDLYYKSPFPICGSNWGGCSSSTCRMFIVAP